MGTEVVWHVFCWGEIVLLWIFPVLIARKVRMLQMGLPLGSPVQATMKLAYYVWIGVQLIIQLVVAWSKGCPSACFACCLTLGSSDPAVPKLCGTSSVGERLCCCGSFRS